MKIITKPEVYLLGKQMMVQAELDRFLADHEVTWQSDSEIGAEVITETAGRVCYMSFAKPRPGGNSAYLDHIKEVGHGSVLEHGVWTLLITGVSRSLTHELVRHRAGFAYSQLSQRYVDESVAEYVCPDVIWQDPELRDIWLVAINHTHAAYQVLAEKLTAKMAADVRRKPVECDACDGTGMLLGHTDGDEECPKCLGTSQCIVEVPQMAATDRRKTARQAARSVLPNATETKITITANARALRHFLEQRGTVHADPEIRKLAGAILDVLRVESPNLFGDYTTEVLPDGTREIKTQWEKV